MDQGEGLEVHHLEKTYSPGQTMGEMGPKDVGYLENPVEAGEVGQGGEVGFERRLCGQVAWGA
ncbi:hypothetical protein MHY01S_21310 [Meiothermus hypogaeus NBRC 106114]|uniref:Uncharacterized protein n=1 Tax=Meiothermus hypogaeus NBRC 106114 TaxID=1227553 RepID=A0A511R3U7_9DEIN|nr:hypothetical protein MHY01S_18520 [Meiothermus hypogaeus NBRC 106114]GEM83965.1 hypothetical protein MHY01S_21310 [Meiothermus hypogaeus NBRC 106114]